MPQPAIVTLKVYNILGQEVASLLENVLMGEGNQRVDFNGKDLASGAYMYRMIAQLASIEDALPGGAPLVSVKKMRLVK